MEKVQIASWAEIADRMPGGDLFIRCVDGRQKKKIKDILVEEFGGSAGAGNNNEHLFVFNAHASITHPFWDARVGPDNVGDYIDADQFFALHDAKDDDDSPVNIDLTTFL